MLGKKICLFGAGATGKVILLPACIGVITLNEPVQA
jgi:hypothetical protein